MMKNIMFKGKEYVPESKLTEQESKQAFLVEGIACGLRFCLTGMTRYYTQIGVTFGNHSLLQSALDSES